MILRWMIAGMLILAGSIFVAVTFPALQPWLNIGSAVILLALAFWFGLYTSKDRRSTAPSVVSSIFISILNVLIAFRGWHIPVPGSIFICLNVLVGMSLLSLYFWPRLSDLTES